MPTRYYLSPIIGDGTEENPYRPKVAEYGLPWTASIASKEDGHPAQMVTVVEVITADHSVLLADNELTDVTAG